MVCAACPCVIDASVSVCLCVHVCVCVLRDCVCVCVCVIGHHRRNKDKGSDSYLPHIASSVGSDKSPPHPKNSPLVDTATSLLSGTIRRLCFHVSPCVSICIRVYV